MYKRTRKSYDFEENPYISWCIAEAATEQLLKNEAVLIMYLKGKKMSTINFSDGMIVPRAHFSATDTDNFCTLQELVSHKEKIITSHICISTIVEETVA